MEEIAKPITATMSKSEREKRVLLKMNKKKRWLQIWKKDDDRVWNRTHNPNNVTAKPNSEREARVQTEVLANVVSIPTPGQRQLAISTKKILIAKLSIMYSIWRTHSRN